MIVAWMSWAWQGKALICWRVAREVAKALACLCRSRRWFAISWLVSLALALNLARLKPLACSALARARSVSVCGFLGVFITAGLHVMRTHAHMHAHMHARTYARTHKHAGTCFTAADIDHKHREMIFGFMPPEASLLVELARQPLLTADKSVLKDQQGAFIHQALLKVASFFLFLFHRGACRYQADTCPYVCFGLFVFPLCVHV